MDKYDYIIFDFDDTIWSRDEDDLECSQYNARFIENNLNEKAIIISGNSYESVNSKLQTVGVEFYNLWADASSVHYKYGIPVSYIEGHRLYDVEFISDYIRNLYLEPILVGYDDYTFNIKIKPIRSNRDRVELCAELDAFFEKNKIDNTEARRTGKTTVDILNVYNSKISVYNYLMLKNYKTLYIGDEIERGNDADIANLCTNKIQIKSVHETKNLLDCFGAKL